MKYPGNVIYAFTEKIDDVAVSIAKTLLAGPIRRQPRGAGKEVHLAESTSAVNVLTALDHLAKRDARYGDVRIGYDMLSDFTHPNMASHASVVEIPTEPGQMHECQIAAQPGSPRSEFIMVVSLPWVFTGLGTIVELLIETAPLLERWLTYLEGDTRVTIDFTK